MEIICIGIAVIVGFWFIAWQRRKPKLNESLFEAEGQQTSFEAEQGALIMMLSSVEADGEDGKNELLLWLFAWANARVCRQLPHILSFFRGRKLTVEQEQYLGFESAVYLYFHLDAWAFGFGQSDRSRAALEDLIEQNVIESFASKDESLRDLGVARFDEYTRSHQSKSQMRTPSDLFLEHLKVLADTGNVNRSIAIPQYGMLEHIADWTMLQGMQYFYLFLRCCKELFTSTTDLSELSAHQMKDIMLAAARTATPVDLSPKKEAEKELVATGQ